MKIMKYKKEKPEGGIFCIPLFLPDWSVREKDDLIRYTAYDFPVEGTYAFARLIEHKSFDLIEVFRHIGAIPENPGILLESGRLFAPVCTCMGLDTGRYRFIFSDAHYDKVRDSAYDEITFLMGEWDIWVGGKQMEIGREKSKALESLHQAMIIYSPTQLEVKIRAAIKPFVNFDYQQAVAAVLDSLPKPKEKDAAFKKRIAPFGVLEQDGQYSLFLEAGSWKNDLFEARGLLGNGYDWAALAADFIAAQMPEWQSDANFDPEAGTFSVSFRNKKALKTFAEAFRAACEKGTVFSLSGKM